MRDGMESAINYSFWGSEGDIMMTEGYHLMSLIILNNLRLLLRDSECMSLGEKMRKLLSVLH